MLHSDADAKSSQAHLLDHNPSKTKEVLHVHIVNREHPTMCSHRLESNREEIALLPRDEERPPIEMTNGVMYQHVPQISRRTALIHVNLRLSIDYDQLALAVSVGERGPPRKVVDFPRKLRTEVSGFWSKRHTTSSQHRAFLVSQSCVSRTLLWTNFFARSMHL